VGPFFSALLTEKILRAPPAFAYRSNAIETTDSALLAAWRGRDNVADIIFTPRLGAKNDTYSRR